MREPSNNSISVIIPTFNSADSLPKAIDSVLAQSLRPQEIIVIDDGSTDETSEILQGYGQKIISLSLKENSGPSLARNMGIKKASGEWIAFLDADDEWLPEKLSEQHTIIQKNPDLVWCGANYYIADGGKRYSQVNPRKVLNSISKGNYFENYFKARVRGQCYILTTTLMVQRKILDKIGLFDPSVIRHQDWELWWRIAHRYPKIGYVAQPMAIRYLDTGDKETKLSRIKPKRGGPLRDIISRHLQISEACGSGNSFRPFAFLRLRNSVLMMLALGFTEDARLSVSQFRRLFPWYWRSSIYLLAVFPKISASILRAVLSVLQLTGICRFNFSPRAFIQQADLLSDSKNPQN